MHQVKAQEKQSVLSLGEWQHEEAEKEKKKNVKVKEKGGGGQVKAKKKISSVTGWYCTCPAGMRTVGCCAHIAAVIWYVARYDPDKYFCVRATCPLRILLIRVLSRPRWKARRPRRRPEEGAGGAPIGLLSYIPIK